MNYESRIGEGLLPGEVIVREDQVRPARRLLPSEAGRPGRLLLTNMRYLRRSEVGKATAGSMPGGLVARERAAEDDIGTVVFEGDVRLDRVVCWEGTRLGRARRERWTVETTDGRRVTAERVEVGADFAARMMQVRERGGLEESEMPTHVSGVVLLADEGVLWEGRPGPWVDRSLKAWVRVGLWLGVTGAVSAALLRPWVMTQFAWSRERPEGGSIVFGFIAALTFVGSLWATVKAFLDHRRLVGEGKYLLTDRRVVLRMGSAMERSLLLEGVDEIVLTVRQEADVQARGELMLVSGPGVRLELRDIADPVGVRSQIMEAREAQLRKRPVPA